MEATNHIPEIDRETELEKRLRGMIRVYEQIKEERDCFAEKLVNETIKNKKLKKRNAELEDQLEELDFLRSELRSLRAYMRAKNF